MDIGIDKITSNHVDMDVDMTDIVDRDGGIDKITTDQFMLTGM